MWEILGITFVVVYFMTSILLLVEYRELLKEGLEESKIKTVAFVIIIIFFGLIIEFFG